MKATRTHLAMLACLSAGAVHANPGAIGGLNSRLESIPDHQFSTTTKLRGEVIFGGAYGDDANSLGESVLFSDRARLNFSSSFTGEDNLSTRIDGYRADLTGAVGYTENQLENLYDDEESFFYNIGARVLYGGSSGKYSYTAGVGAGTTYYDSDVVREGDDSFINDFEGAFALRSQFSNSFRIDSSVSLYYGGHTDVGRGFARNSIEMQDYFWWNTNTNASYRFDGQDVGDAGVEWSTNFGWGGVKGSEDDEHDNYSNTIRQEGRYNFANGTTAFLEGRYGRRTWDVMDDYDSNSFRFGGGVRGTAGRFSGEIKGGYEYREYDENSLNDDEQGELYVEGLLTGQWDRLVLGVYGSYGIQEFHGEGASGLDPVGIRGGIRGVYAYNETTRFTTDWNYTTFELSDVVSSHSDDHWLRWTCGLGCEHDLNDSLTFGLGCSLILLDDDSKDETHTTATLRTRFRW